MDALKNYKLGLINLGQTSTQKKFIENSFTRWFLAAPLKNEMPSCNIVNENDLYYANKNMKTRFDVPNFIQKSKKLFASTFEKATSSVYPNIDNKVTSAQLQHIKELYVGDNYENDKNKLLAMYNFIGMNSIHLSIPPIFNGIELFGSPLNTHGPYCSPFEIDKKFGSLGSFFNFEPTKETIYLCNPPFDEIIIRRMSLRLLDFLSRKKRMIIIITLPIWDSESQRKLKIRDFGLEFEGFSELKKSKYCQETDMLDKDEYPYWDYYLERPIPASHTHLMVMSNFDSEKLIKKIKTMWTEWKSKF
jgi:Phosphorylated CTD interacting factor 1 WW domain